MGCSLFMCRPSCSQGGGVYISGISTKVDFIGCNIYSNNATGYVSTCCQNILPNAPMGSSADVYASTRAGGVWVASWWRQWVRARVSNFPRPVPHCPHGKLAFLFSQGGGIYVKSGTETFESCEIHNNLAPEVSARLLNSP